MSHIPGFQSHPSPYTMTPMQVGQPAPKPGHVATTSFGLDLFGSGAPAVQAPPQPQPQPPQRPASPPGLSRLGEVFARLTSKITNSRALQAIKNAPAFQRFSTGAASLMRGGKPDGVGGKPDGVGGKPDGVGGKPDWAGAGKPDWAGTGKPEWAGQGRPPFAGTPGGPRGYFG